MRKESFKHTFFEINKFPKKEPINFGKFYDNGETTQSETDHFINPTVWYIIRPFDAIDFGVNRLS